MKSRVRLHIGSVPAPFFVVCSARSGSTLLRYVLDTHPEVVCPPELHLAATCAELLATMPAREVRAFGDATLAVHAGTGVNTIVEKSTTTVFHLDAVRAVFSDASFICLHRDGRDVVASALEVAGSGSYGFEPHLRDDPEHPVAALLRYWCDVTERMFDLERAAPCLSIRYEDLVLDPDATVGRLASFLGVEQFEGWIDRVFATPHAVGPGTADILFTDRIRDDSIGGGRALTLADVPGAVRRRWTEVSTRLGYDTDLSPPAPARPPVPTTRAELEAVIASVDGAVQSGLGAVGSLCIVLLDVDGAVWTIDPSLGVVDGNEAGRVDHFVTTDAATLLALARDEENPWKAFRRGRVRSATGFDAVMTLHALLRAGRQYSHDTSV